MPIPRTARRLVLGVILACCAVTGGASAASASGDDTDGVGITVEVVGPSPTPTSPADPPKPGSRGGAVTQETITDPVAADEALGDDPFDLGGVLYIGGLTSSVSPSFGPDSGEVTLRLTVRNVSSTAFDSRVRFWLDNATGGEVDTVNGVRIDDLKPDETRTISATMSGLGQWTLLHGHATLAPPKVVEDTQLVPLTRDTIVVLPPLFTVSVAGGLGVLGFAGWWALAGRGLGLAKLLGLGGLRT